MPHYSGMLALSPIVRCVILIMIIILFPSFFFKKENKILLIRKNKREEFLEALMTERSINRYSTVPGLLISFIYVLLQQNVQCSFTNEM